MENKHSTMLSILSEGYTDAVKALTKELAVNPKAVLEFEAIFDALMHDGAIDWKSPPDAEEAFEEIFWDADEMEKFVGSSGRMLSSFFVMTNHGDEVTIEIGWDDSMAGRILWNRWLKKLDDPVLLFAELGFKFDEKYYQLATKPRDKAEPQLYHYHPERFRVYRNYTKSVADFYKKNVEPGSGMLDIDGISAVMQYVTDDISKNLAKFPRKLMDDYPAPMFVIEAEENLATAYGRFVQAGKQIFDFPSELSTLFTQTDVAEIPLGSIKLPYNSLYLYFGIIEELEFESGWFFDGAYVESRGSIGDIRFTLTAAPKERFLSKLWYLYPEVEYTQDLVFKYRDKNLSEAISESLAERLEYIREKQRNGIGKNLEFEGHTVVDLSSKNSFKREEITLERHKVYTPALQLVVNALCYITAYPEDIEEVWPEGTPDSMKKKTTHGTAKEQARAKSKLASMGYVPVYLCGKNLADQHGVLEASKNKGKKPSTHWRRGHWRNQAYGKERSLHRLIWVMPVLVGRTNEQSEPTDGHVYKCASFDGPQM